MRPLITAAVVTTTLAACQPERSVTPVCDPANHSALTGRNIGEVNLPADQPHRIISPGNMVTQDFQPNRINIFVDEKGWIARVTCG